MTILRLPAWTTWIRASGWALAAAVWLSVTPIASQAEGDIGPMRLGLPGLWDTVVGPELGGSPFRLGFYGEHGVIDDGHGFEGLGILPPVTTQQMRAQLAFRIARGVILSASLPYRRYDIASGEGVEAVSADGMGDFEASMAVHLFSFSNGDWRTGLWGSLRMPTGDVEIQAEGEDQALFDLFQWCHKGPSFARVLSVKESYSEATGIFDSFEVKY